jgi:hypothetical protein
LGNRDDDTDLEESSSDVEDPVCASAPTPDKAITIPAHTNAVLRAHGPTAFLRSVSSLIGPMVVTRDQDERSRANKNAVI